MELNSYKSVPLAPERRKKLSLSDGDLLTQIDINHIVHEYLPFMFKASKLSVPDKATSADLLRIRSDVIKSLMLCGQQMFEPDLYEPKYVYNADGVWFCTSGLIFVRELKHILAIKLSFG